MIIAIDPGISGAIAFLDDDGRVGVDSMPPTLRDIAEHLISLGPSVAYLEDVGRHVQGNNAQASATFARHCGALEMALVCLRIPFQSIAPRKWQKAYTLPKDKADKKRAIRDLMQRRYPDIKVTLVNADALAILTAATDRIGL